MYEYVVTNVGFVLDGKDYNVGDVVTGDAVKSLEANSHLLVRCVRRVVAKASAPPAEPPAK